MKNLFDKIYLTWRKSKGDHRKIVGELSVFDNVVDFTYKGNNIKEALREGFIGYPGLSFDANKKYNNVLKMFSSRLINTDRNDIKDFLDFWEINQECKKDKIYLLAMSQGLTGTDNFEFLANYYVDNNKPFLRFVTDIAGLQYHCNDDVFNKIKKGNNLEFELEPNNKYDKQTVKVLFNNTFIGHIKKGHNNVFYQTDANKIQLEVKKSIQNGNKQLFVVVSLC